MTLKYSYMPHMNQVQGGTVPFILTPILQCSMLTGRVKLRKHENAEITNMLKNYGYGKLLGAALHIAYLQKGKSKVQN